MLYLHGLQRVRAVVCLWGEAIQCPSNLLPIGIALALCGVDGDPSAVQT